MTDQDASLPTPRAYASPLASPDHAHAPPPRRDRVTPATAFDEAESVIEAGRFSSAAAVVRHALTLDPDNPSLHAMAAYVDAQLNWPSTAHADDDIPAIAHLTQLIRRAPSCALAHGYRGMLRARLGKSEAAKKDLREATRLNPLHPGMRRALQALEGRRRSKDEDETERASWWRKLLGA